jgi:hypothetical protein
MKKYCAVVVLLILGPLSVEARTAKKPRMDQFRMVSRKNSVALKRYTPWVDWETVRFMKEGANRLNSSVERWIEQKKQFLFIPLPAKRIE